MDYLLQNLHEQQIQLQAEHFSFHDLANMENLDGKPPPPPPRKYVSIFRIDGEPILPPLMTEEKRKQMQKLKEKALLVEEHLNKLKHQQLYKNCPYNENTKKDVDLHRPQGNLSQRSHNNSECRLNETAESIDFLKSILLRQLEEDKTGDTSMFLNKSKSEEKLQKLQKSETLIYDNSTNEIIKIPNENQVNAEENQQKQLRNLNNSPNKKSSHLLLAGTNIKGIAAIPSICLNPPTPLTVDKNLYDTLSGAESNESVITSENQNRSLDFSRELSSDESFNSMLTHSDKKTYRNIHLYSNKLDKKDESSKNIVRKPLTPEKNVSAKIQQFEAISSDTNTPETSPEKTYNNRKLCLGTPSGTMNRSATSPSIKLNTSNRSSSSRLQSLVQDSDNSPESNLIRSSSFTLEGPSKALIDHMQQQKVLNEAKVRLNTSASTSRNSTRKSISAPLRAHSDTVESKAKKVQKMEFKSLKPKSQPKRIQSKLSQAAAASISPYNTNNSVQHTNYVCKTNRSPSHTSPQAMHNSISNQMRKSNSTSTCLTHNKISKSRMTSSLSTTVSSSSSKKSQTGNKTLNDMERKKEKILKLLAEQEEEHRRLQHSFEMQQKILIEKLNREMAGSDISSSNNSHSSLSTTSRSQHKQFAEQKILSPRQLNHNHSGQKSTASSQHQSPSSISNNCSYIDFNNKHTHIENSHQNPSYDSNFTHSTQPISFNNSQISLMDHSNANTSLDISTLSMQTSPDTPLIQNNTGKNIVNKTTPSFCRRLFTTEINGALSSRSTAKTSRSAGSTSMESRNQPQLFNHDTYRRAPEGNSFILDEAATKINAFARGFLVRRLFKTEQIQRIVQTIRDTLIFVLNLHIETIENPEESQTPANIKLKARLLQQLSSACRTLYLVFFQTSIKERMEIIARDRKRIKTKLMTMNRKRTPTITALKED